MVTRSWFVAAILKMAAILDFFSWHYLKCYSIEKNLPLCQISCTLTRYFYIKEAMWHSALIHMPHGGHLKNGGHIGFFSIGTISYIVQCIKIYYCAKLHAIWPDISTLKGNVELRPDSCATWRSS